tara:strand:- start:828 stop:1019 length:192 start_codon:yes stop_codon:yes gene_type:complete
MILDTGDLVRIGSVLDLPRNNVAIGIIIQCVYGFGWGAEEWIILVNGKLQRISSEMIWPLKEN